MNNQEKLTIRSRKLKVYWVNLQAISLHSFAFCLLFIIFFKSKIYIWYTFDYVGGWETKKFSPGPFPETRLLFFGLCFAKKLKTEKLKAFNNGVYLKNSWIIIEYLFYRILCAALSILSSNNISFNPLNLEILILSNQSVI